MKPKIAIRLIILVFIISACTSQPPQVSSEAVSITPDASTPGSPPPKLEATQTRIQASSTATNTPTITATATQEAALTPASTSSPDLVESPTHNLIIDHTSVEVFETIPDEYIEAASQLSLLFRHASVGANISQGLDCLMNKTQPRPHFCDQGIPNDQILYDPKYNRDQWVFEFHQPPPAQNPGWYNKVSLFIERIDSLDSTESYGFTGFKFGYVDAIPGSEIEDQFFNDPNSMYPTIKDLEDLEARHPEMRFVYWTLALGRAIGSEESDRFNQQLRAYANDHDKILMDIADIESHTPDGAPCFDNAGQGREAICDEYTDEVNAGHLNALGNQRLAKAMWVLMARLAGWEEIP